MNKKKGTRGKKLGLENESAKVVRLGLDKMGDLVLDEVILIVHRGLEENGEMKKPSTPLSD